MAKWSIANLNRLKILDENTKEAHFGGNQTWYRTKWQRMAGCGPTVATNLFSYLSTTPAVSNPVVSESIENVNHKETWVERMEEIWKHVTPSVRGVHTTKMFYEPLLNYIESQGLTVDYRFCDVPEKKSKRPQWVEVLSFIKEALIHDAPVAFLNLCNGEVQNLDRWHWVTIVSLEHTEGESAFVEILDEGQIKKIDLTLWYETTKKGGGFVYFRESVGDGI